MLKRLFIIVMVGGSFFGPAHGQSYPTRSIELIVPIAAGGGMDIQTRLLADLVKGDLNQTLTVCLFSGEWFRWVGDGSL